MSVPTDRPGARTVPRRGPLLPTLAVLAVVVTLLGLGANIWTEVLWFDQLGFREVYTTRLLTQLALFVVGAALMAAAVAFSMNLAYRSRPVYAPVDEHQQNLDRYRESLEPLRRLVLVALPAGLGLFAGSAAAAQWTTVLTWLNGQPFGTTDPEFGMDVGFYVFTLPFLRFVVGFLMAVLVLSLLAGAATHYLYGGLRIQGRGPRTTSTARVHLAVLLGLVVLVQAASYWLDRYSQLTDSTGLITGATYTGINAQIPARTILAIIAVLVALLFFATAGRGSWRLPGYGIALMLVSAIAVGAIFPAALQQLRVRPSQATLELPFIERNIAATRAAYGLEDVEVQTYDPESTPQQGALAADAQTAASIRLLDPQLVSDAFRQLQRTRTYYNFPDSLDVDRYTIDGESRDTVIAVRELDLPGVPSGQRNWLTDHAIYTHGYGVVAAYGNERTASGEPNFFQRGIPSVGELDLQEPRIYFGERSPEFSIVGAPAGDPPRELDYPSDSEESDSGQTNTTFSGDGGPRVGNFLNQLLYAIKFQDQNIVLSDAVNSESQILYDRDPRERVEKVAPYLTLDGDPYPSVVDGQVVWIVDGYTTSANYPYSDLQQLGEATVDAVTAQSNAVVAVEGEVNYIRNSVKATVNAYDGGVDLYAWDVDDPILQTWQEIFPASVQPMSEISADLMSHLRYPEDLFKVQRELLARYHVTQPSEFFSGGDFWNVPPDPTRGSADGIVQPPYYLTLQMPGQESPSFSLSTSYIPRSNAGGGGTANTLTGFLAVDADAGSEQGTRAESYGTLRLLEMPRNTGQSGPGQVQNDFNTFPQAQSQLRLLEEGNSEVLRGNLLTLPVAGGLLYVQPVYIQGQTETAFPLLQFVLASFGDQIGFAPTLDEALDIVFGGDSGVDAGDSGADPGTGVVDPGTGAVPPTGSAEQQLDQALADANAALAASQEALAAGDFAAYGQAQADLQAAIERAVAARPADDPTDAATDGGATDGAAPAPTPTE